MKKSLSFLLVLSCLISTAQTKIHLNFKKTTVKGDTTVVVIPPTVQVLSSFTLINASNNQDIQTINNGATLNLASLPSRNLNVRANTTPNPVGSVVFNLTGAQTRSQTETAAPYALFGDLSGVFNAWTPTLGNYTLSATPFTAASGGGTAGTSLSITFRVIDSGATVTPAPPTLTADDNANTISATSPLGLSEILVQIGNGNFGQYTGPIDVGTGSVPPGYYIFKIKAATGRSESATVSSPAFTANSTTTPLGGDTTQNNSAMSVVTVQVTYSSAPTNPSATFADLMNNKRVGFILTKDDGNVGDYNIVYPVINGGTSPTNGHTYPGMTYSDGTGATRNWGYTFAINGRGTTSKDGSNTTVTSWAQYRDLLRNKNFALANHSADHSNTGGGYYQLATNDSIIKAQLGFRMRSVVLPAGLGGFVAGGLQLGYINAWSSEGYGGPGNPSADGHDSEIYWGETFDAPTIAGSLPGRHMLGTRLNFDGLYNDANRGFRNWIDAKYAEADQYNSKQVYTCFSHGPEAGWEADSLYSMLQYIQNHPKAQGNVWYPNLQQFAEYMETKNLAIKSAPVVNGNTVTYTIDLKNLNPLHRYKDMSLLVSTVGTISNVVVAGADKYTYNASTGLVNIYKGGQVNGGITSPATITANSSGPAPTFSPSDTVGKVYGKIPWSSWRGAVMDHNTNRFDQLQDGKFDNVDIAQSALVNTPDIVIGFDPRIKAVVKEVHFGDGQHNHAAGSPMKSWFYNSGDYSRIPGPDFTGNLNYAWDNQVLQTPVRTDYFGFQQYYPIPTELEFYGWYSPTYTSTYPKPTTGFDQQAGTVTYPWDMQKVSGQGIDNVKFNLARNLNIYRIYMDIGNLQEDHTGLAIFNPEDGAWQTDMMLDSLKRNGKEVLFCIKGREGFDDYVEMCRQVAIRYGNNPNYPDSGVHIFTGPGYPANVVKKGLNLIKRIQLGNEPNRWWKGPWSPTNGEGMMTPFQLAAMWKRCYDAVKSVDPTIEVVTAGLASNDPGYYFAANLWSKMYNGGKPIFDAISYHEYNNTESGQNQSGGTPPGVAPEPARMLERAKNILQTEWEINNKTQVYITETGYSISKQNTTNAVPANGIGSKDNLHVQGDWSIRSSLATARAGITGVTFYEMYDDGYYVDNDTSWLNWDLSCGLIHTAKDKVTFTPRPAFNYLTQAGNLLRGYVIESTTMNSDSVYVDKFVKSGYPTIWSIVKGTASGATSPYTLTLSSNPPSVEVNTLSDNSTIPIKQTVPTSGSYSLIATETPIFIKENPLLQ